MKRLLLLLLPLSGFSLGGFAAERRSEIVSVPGWWLVAGFRVDHPPEDFAAANCGQVRWFAAAALDAIDRAVGVKEGKVSSERAEVMKALGAGLPDDFEVARVAWAMEERAKLGRYAASVGVFLLGPGGSSMVPTRSSDGERALVLGQLKHAFDWTPVRAMRRGTAIASP